MEPILLTASEEEKNQRLDAFLASGFDGLTRSLAVKLIESGAEYLPMVNQIEHHPRNSQRGIVEVCKELGIQLEAYSPLMCAPLNSETLLRIAAVHDKSTAQVILRWNIQLGIIPLPKSGNPERIQENIDIFDFELTPEEMTSINLLNTDSIYLDPETYCPGFSRFRQQ